MTGSPIGPYLRSVDNPRIGSMFSGVGGLDLALHVLWPGSDIAWLCEWDEPASRVLDARFPGVPNHRDVSAVDWTSVEPVDVVCGGFPCQDISKAGKRAGIKEGTRSGLWFRMLDAVRVLRPRLLLLENVAAIASGGGLDVVLGSLAEAGWDAEWTLLRASDVGAPHRRDRWFCVAYPHGERPVDVEPRVLSGQAGVEAQRDTAGRGVDAPHTHVTGLEGRGTERERADELPAGTGGLDAPADPSGTGGLGTVEHQGGRPGPTDGRVPAADTDVAGGEARHPGTVGDAPSGRLQPVVGGGTDWGEYAGAIARWERIIGRPAPAPTDDRGRLSPDFTEWMMGWPAGWTDIPGATRSHRLKQCGNGVVPLQAYAAYTYLLAAVDKARQKQAA